MAEPTDEEIAVRVQRGDDQAFGDLMRRYERKITRFGRKFLSVDEDIEDMVQEIFVKAFTNIQSFDPRQRFSPWIYRIAHNHFVDALKEKGREPISFFDLDVFLPHIVARETPDGHVDREELKRMLDLSLNELGPKYREPLILHYFEDFGYKEISDILRIPVSTVGVRLQRGRTMMRRILEKAGQTK